MMEAHPRPAPALKRKGRKRLDIYVLPLQSNVMTKDRLFLQDMVFALKQAGRRAERLGLLRT